MTPEKSDLNKHEEAALAQTLDHEKLDVYQFAIDFVTYTKGVVHGLPHEHAHLADQLRRAASSVVLNTAEGTGRMGGADKARFFGFARGSAAECGAVLDVLKAFDAISVSEHLAGKSRVKRLVCMLVRLGQKARERR